MNGLVPSTNRDPKLDTDEWDGKGESLQTSRFDSVVCAVMTGMGADGTEGIGKLKASKKSYVIAQDQDTSVVFGMPKSIIAAGLADQVVPLDQIAQEIILHVGVVK